MLRITLCFGLLLLCCFVGCDNGPVLVPVSGKVTIEGKPVKAGFVRIVPGNGRPALGKIEPDGSFKMMTDKKEGVLAGEHPVEIIAFDTINRQKVWFAPMFYNDYLKSKLTAKIDGPMDNLTYDLKWDTEEHRTAGSFKEAMVME
jgi:hypothetical protein